jgi:general secretion pathway protein N
VKRWVAGGIVLGSLLGLLWFAPAAWLAAWVNSASGGRLLLADARGSVWHGSAVVVLTGGAQSRDASALPGRMTWRLVPQGRGLTLHVSHACCVQGEPAIHLLPGLGSLRVELPPAQGAPTTHLGQWPAAWLAGLGTPWNTVQPSGTLRLSSPGFAFEWRASHWVFTGSAEIELGAMASRLSTLDVLGSYRLRLDGDARGDAASVQLGTLGGALQLVGSGQWVASKLRFSGQASAAPGAEAALNNLLGILGRRQGAVSLLSIG